MSASAPRFPRFVPVVACLAILATYVTLIDLKGISTDEGLRVGIINGGEPFLTVEPSPRATWDAVIAANSFSAYQPLYFLIQNSLMRLAGTHSAIFFRGVNIFFLSVVLAGLLALSAGWRLAPRLFLLGLFGFNAYLLMHVLQIREYIVGVAFYVWSTWLVLRLDRRPLGRAWADVAWFAAYGLLLTFGFFVQSWVVFPAIGQGLFLVLRRRGDWLRFHAHLALSYVIVLSVTWPYLQQNHQKADVGRWGAEGTALWPQLSDGFHLVLAGHLAGQSRFTDFLFWFWPLVAGVAAALLFSGRFAARPGMPDREFKRQGALVLLCSAVSLAFQIGYFLKVENLSVWPRYFVIHYFFLTWLVALGFNYLHELRAASFAPRRLAVLLGALGMMLVASAIFQTHSYYQAPYLDTGFSRNSNWRGWGRELVQVARPRDAVLIHDFVQRSTLTFTQPIPQRLILLPELEASDLHAVDRVVYLDSSQSLAERGVLQSRLAAMSFPRMQEIALHGAEDGTVLTDCRLLVFSRQ
ncbi:MAG: hypothetical protein JWO82_2845 [Akkermansiaceae bacterium]|nr:hypothetical protein [Akkermansiaceae bacterium]